MNGDEKSWGKTIDLFRERVDLAFGSAHAFESFRPGVRSAEHHLNITMNNHGNIPFSILMGVICGASLTIIPAYARDNYQLTVEIWNGNTKVRSYAYDDYDVTWNEFFLVFGTPFTRGQREVALDVFDNMLFNAVRDMKRDGIGRPDEHGEHPSNR